MSRPYSKHRGNGMGRGFSQGNINEQGGRNFRADGRVSNNHGGGPGNKKNNNKNNNNNNDGGRGGASASIMTTLLDLLLQKSASQIFEPTSGLLNLSNFHASPDLASVQRNVDFDSVAFCRCLVDVIKNRIGNDLRILVLNDNNIRKLTAFLTALEEAGVCRGVTAISATGNEIWDFSFLGPLQKYGNLGELLLKGNPITQRADYREKVIKTLPKLMMLDSEIIERGLLRLPNPVPTSLNEAQLGVLRFLENNVFAAAASRNYDSLVNFYSPNVVYSVSRAEEPIPRRLQWDAKRNGHSVTTQQRNVMANDFITLKRMVQWRNLHNDVQSLRNVTLGRAKASLALQAIGGGERKFLSVSHELNGNANVVFLSQGMKVPTCVLTVHGKLYWHWSPKNGDGTDLIPRNVAPFFTCFFDRTMSLLLDNNTHTWVVHNDMVFLRPDRTVVNEDGSSSSPLFFANEATRVESMRRRLLPKATPDVMRAIVEHVGSDADLQAFISGHLAKLPTENLESALTSPEVMLALLR